MAEKDARNVLQTVTAEIIAEVAGMIGVARHAALATLDPENGWPLASRVGLATLPSGAPVIVASALTPHFSALRADPRCSLLIGAIGRGDPLAHPRVTLRCMATMLEPGLHEDSLARQRYRAGHPKAAIYLDLPDFRLFRLDIASARFNGGFGRAYEIEGAALQT